MYLDYFGLDEAPFRITPHTDFFFDGANRGATLDALIYAITHDEGIVRVSGEVGSGKTMLCRVLMERLPDTVKIIYLANPTLSRDDILYAIADELHLTIPDNARIAVVLRLLHEHLIEIFATGHQVVILIDEAHAMPVSTLEEIRLLSNLETNRNKLLQLVLFGQPELDNILARADMRQLKERITHNFRLEPLVRDDIANYLEFRLRAAGYKGPTPFTELSIKRISAVSQGLNRRINILADKALLAAYSANSHQIGKREIDAAIRDCEFSAATHADTTRPKLHPKRLLVPLSLLGLLGLLAAALWIGISLSKNAADHPPPTTTTSIASTSTTSTPTTTQAPAAPVHPYSLQALTQARLAAGQAWLERADNRHWFIQVLGIPADQRSRIEDLLRNPALNENDLDNIRVYYSELSGQPRYGLIYGDYPTQEAALTALRQLPPALKAAKPYPRQVMKLRPGQG